MTELRPETKSILDATAGGTVLVLTGAGISAESGIPTFRGAEGYWVEGSRNYQPMELATHEAFLDRPDTVWAWYLYRRGICRAAKPNRAHEALVALERALGDRFLLVTQNVDGLHVRAGNSVERTYAIHGNLERMRCARECDGRLHPMPDGLADEWPKGRTMDAATRALLVCPSCGGRARPHVLWFDESYDEPRFRFESTRREAASRDLLVVVGTAGATNLPMQVGSIFARRGAPSIVVDLEANPFTELAQRSGGSFERGTAGELVPAIVRGLGG